jgi:hypothetical protein
MATFGNVSGIKRIMRAKEGRGKVETRPNHTAALLTSTPSIRNVSGKTAKGEEP